MTKDHIPFDIELSLLDLNFQLKENDHMNGDVLFELLQAGNFQDVLKLNPSFLQCVPETVELNVKKYLDDNALNETKLFHLFCVGVSSLQLFVQSNWLGLSCPQLLERNIDNELKKNLALDAECFHPTIKDLHLLSLAKTILFDHKDKFACFKLSTWWVMRYIFVHQRVLEEASQLLHSAFLGVISGTINIIEKFLEGNTLVGSLLQLEIGYTYLLYGELQNAKLHFEKADEIAGFHCEWKGALGKRTYFQQKALPQLTVRVQCTLDDVLKETDRQILSDAPKDIKLQDDTRLNQIAFIDKDDNVLPELHPIYQALLIAHATHIEKFHPKDELLLEEVMPLLNCILGYPKVWSFHVSALLKRSKLESTQRRAVERSMLQLQELVDSISKTKPSFERRIEYFYASQMPLEYELQGYLAEIFQSLGAINSALDIYIRIQMWEGVIACYQQLEKKHKAEEIVRQELAKAETPKLWCLLGNCTDDVACYEKAWELSKHSSARAQRDWALYFYYKKQFRECIPHFQESLQVNSLQESVWIRLAFSAMEIEDWETAAMSYRRYCALNSDSFEAWNNVAKCYAKLGQKARAWKALQEAVKCNYESWMVWDNLMVVSVDCCEYEEAIRSYNRILDLKEKHVDIQVLRILVQAITESKLDNYERSVTQLTGILKKLFGRLSSQVTNNAQLWELYADLVSIDTDTEVNATFRLVQLLQKAYRSAMQEKNWEKDVESCVAKLSLCGKYAQSCLDLLEKQKDNESLHIASSAKLSLRSVVSQIKLCYGNTIPSIVDTAIIDLEKLQTELEIKLKS